eukprot:scaffold80545_cov53-Phaeocystis_antarctica.AAC.1
MSALSLALRQSACHSERNGSGPQEVAVAQRGNSGGCAHTGSTARMQARVLLAPAARPPAPAPPGSNRNLLDAVGALERLRVVPRLQQQHRVPDGADAVAEQRQIGAHVGLPHHVVAHPEERVLLRQPLLLEEVSERVEQRGDRRVEEPAHKDVGLAHVRRTLRLQPLAHGQRVLLFRAVDVELVDVAVFHVVLGELGLACDLVAWDVGVDLLHRVARQLR